MLINAQTKISKLLQHHPDALETIITVSPDFKKLRNPLLRKLMAGRTSIAMASKIGGVTPEDFFKALAPLGFEVDTQTQQQEEKPESTPMPDYIKNLRPEQKVNFDVRAMLADGKDPLRDIQIKVKSLKPGEALIIINDFEPIPLIRVLEKQGYQSWVNYIDKDTIETYFYSEGHAKSSLVIEEMATSGDWDSILKSYEGNLVEIDVRHLEMPGPMMTILETLEEMPDDKALYVNHKKVPMFLLSELKDRNYDYRIKDVQEGEVYLIIFKNK